MSLEELSPSAVTQPPHEIPLTRGKSTLVDYVDYIRLRPFSWFYTNAGYATGRMGGKQLLLMHRVILNALPGVLVDHKNRNALDNRRCNIRLCTPTQNHGNRLPQLQVGKTSRYKGVCFARREHHWIAYIYVNGKQRRLGYFNDEHDAAIAYNQAAIVQFGEFALLNVVE